MLITMCIECNTRKRMLPETFLCEICFDEFAARLREKYGHGKAAFMKREYGKWKQIAEQNGICYETFRQRVHAGLSLEEAATKPLRVRNYHKTIKQVKDELSKYGIEVKRSQIYYCLKRKKLSVDETIEFLKERAKAG